MTSSITSPDNEEQTVHWKSNKRFNINIKSEEITAQLHTLKAGTLMCNLPIGLTIMANAHEIIFRLVPKWPNGRRWGHCQVSFSKDNKSVYHYVSQLPTESHWHWFNSAVRELLPMARKLYS